MINKCERCGKNYEDYPVEKYNPELNGNDYCKTCRDFLLTKTEDSKPKKTKVKISWSYYWLPGFEPAPNGIGYVRKKEVKE